MRCVLQIVQPPLIPRMNGKQEDPPVSSVVISALVFKLVVGLEDCIQSVALVCEYGLRSMAQALIGQAVHIQVAGF